MRRKDEEEEDEEEDEKLEEAIRIPGGGADCFFSGALFHSWSKTRGKMDEGREVERNGEHVRTRRTD